MYKCKAHEKIFDTKLLIKNFNFKNESDNTLLRNEKKIISSHKIYSFYFVCNNFSYKYILHLNPYTTYIKGFIYTSYIKFNVAIYL